LRGRVDLVPDSCHKPAVALEPPPAVTPRSSAPARECSGR
jgi:hypothetical protein